jgi:hypothetical protein
MLGPSRWLPQSGANPAVLALARLPAPPGIVPGFPGLCPAVLPPLPSMARRLRIRRMGRRPQVERKAKLMTSTLSAILSALELGHLDHTGDLRTLEAPPPPKPWNKPSALSGAIFSRFSL